LSFPCNRFCVTRSDRTRTSIMKIFHLPRVNSSDSVCTDLQSMVERQACELVRTCPSDAVVQGHVRRRGHQIRAADVHSLRCTPRVVQRAQQPLHRIQDCLRTLWQFRICKHEQYNIQRKLVTQFCRGQTAGRLKKCIASYGEILVLIDIFWLPFSENAMFPVFEQTGGAENHQNLKF
jgi:hypothetical protein